MDEPRRPKDEALAWPLERPELDDVEMLEMQRDEETGRLAWHGLEPPAGPDGYRAWMPRRARGAAAPEAAAVPPPADATPPLPLHDMLPEDEQRDAPDLLVAPTWLPPADEAEVAAEAMPAQNDDRVVAPTDDADDATAPLGVAALTAPRPTPGGRRAAEIRATRARSTTTANVPAAVRAARHRVTLERAALLAGGAMLGALLMAGSTWRRPSETGTSAATSVASVSPAAAPAPPRDAPPPPSAASTTPDPPAPAPATSSEPSARAGRTAAAPPATDDRSRDEAAPRRPDVARALPSAAANPAPSSASPASRVDAPPETATPVPRAAETRAGREPRDRRALPDRAAPVAALSTPATTPRPAARRTSPTAARPLPPAALELVDNYAAAYSRMDARATQALWPAADRAALAQTFNALREQRLTLSRCRGAESDAGALVTCQGTLRYRPRLGDHATRVREGRWRFTLVQGAGGWEIREVIAP